VWVSREAKRIMIPLIKETLWKWPYLRQQLNKNHSKPALSSHAVTVVASCLSAQIFQGVSKPLKKAQNLLSAM